MKSGPLHSAALSLLFLVSVVATGKTSVDDGRRLNVFSRMEGLLSSIEDDVSRLRNIEKKLREFSASGFTDPCEVLRGFEAMSCSFIDALRLTGLYPGLADRKRGEEDREAKKRQEKEKDRILSMPRDVFLRDLGKRHESMVNNKNLETYMSKIAEYDIILERLRENKAAADEKRNYYETKNRPEESIVRCEEAVKEIEESLKSSSERMREYKNKLNECNGMIAYYGSAGFTEKMDVSELDRVLGENAAPVLLKAHTAVQQSLCKNLRAYIKLNKYGGEKREESGSSSKEEAKTSSSKDDDSDTNKSPGRSVGGSTVQNGKLSETPSTNQSSDNSGSDVSATSTSPSDSESEGSTSASAKSSSTEKSKPAEPIKEKGKPTKVRWSTLKAASDEASPTEKPSIRRRKSPKE